MKTEKGIRTSHWHRFFLICEIRQIRVNPWFRTAVIGF
ncbi:Uncharacterized protein dnm_085380 [Desulfonema magnum]|uniref:Uncharacterized protein n=1 Tax=Desulfonema magnum TaxID=45655 RepID=A0A975GTT3_9BACT|nr:Uncharacterized protein dnm_085380 [Desulfonema magnum]